jgi:seryl-tRNA synthetase
MIDTAKVFELKRAIQALIKERPELAAFQKEIDKTLAGAGSQHNRMVLLQRMMREKQQELNSVLNTLKEELLKWAAEIEKQRGDK